MFTIRNDDVAFDTDIEEMKKFCEICDRHGYPIIQSITLIGEHQKTREAMLNDEIKLASNQRFEENQELVNFLKSRSDSIGVHGLWHTHQPTEEEIVRAKTLLQELGLNPTYFVPPFNQGEYPGKIAGLTTCQLSLEKGERLEDFLERGDPVAPIMYLHSWRFNNNWYSFEQLDHCLKRLATKIKKISDAPADQARLWYNDWVRDNARGKVLDIGKSRHWDYGFPTLDSNPKLNPTFVGSVEKTDFPDETFDTVLCNGRYELVENPQQMIDEVLRITKKGGTAIFGFVGRDYQPYLSPWKFYEGKEKLPPHTKKDFGQEYHFLIVTRQ